MYMHSSPFIVQYLFYNGNNDIWNVPSILIRNLIWVLQHREVSGTNKLYLTAWMYEKAVTNYPFQKKTSADLVAFPEMEQSNTLWLRNGCEPGVSTLR